MYSKEKIDEFLLSMTRLVSGRRGVVATVTVKVAVRVEFIVALVITCF